MTITPKAVESPLLTEMKKLPEGQSFKAERMSTVIGSLKPMIVAQN